MHPQSLKRLRTEGGKNFTNVNYNLFVIENSFLSNFFGKHKLLYSNISIHNTILKV